MLLELGKETSKQQLEQTWNSQESTILDYDRDRIYTPEEFYNNRSMALKWSELGELRRGLVSSNPTVFFLNLGKNGFDGFLDTLLQKLTEKELMTLDQYKEGSYHLIGAEEGGITLHLRDGQDPHGRAAYSPKTYYPMQEIDAIEYAKHFFRRPLIIAKVISISKPERTD